MIKDMEDRIEELIDIVQARLKPGEKRALSCVVTGVHMRTHARREGKLVVNVSNTQGGYYFTTVQKEVLKVDDFEYVPALALTRFLNGKGV